MNHASLARRLRALEMLHKAIPREEAAATEARIQHASVTFWDVMELHFPRDDAHEVPHPLRRSTSDKALAAARRLLASEGTAEDQAAFEDLPTFVLSAFGAQDLQELLQFVIVTLEGSITWEGNQPRFVASAAPDAATPTGEVPS